MKIGEDYVQFSKALAVAMLLSYVIQIAATFIAICVNADLANPLLQLIGNAMSFYGIVYGCYAGNSAIEKAVNAGKLTANTETNNVG